MTTDTLRNDVVVFGEAGVGKSSVINMLARRLVAQPSSGAKGCTFQCQKHPVDIDKIPKSVNLWETSGLNGEEGESAAKQAIINLLELIRSWENGISLLVYCVRGPRVKESTVHNYQIFYQALCQEKVPIVLVVTGL